jgi:hypothetical protein
MSAFDAVDGSSTGTEVPWIWVLLRPPRFGGAKHASGHDHRLSPAILTSSQRVNSMPSSRIPYATEQGISKRVSGKVFEEQGIAT